jgi:uncharacterized protein YodC (DUF2158 family)
MLLLDGRRAQELKQGDSVKLKPGRLTMTIRKINGDTATCHWTFGELSETAKFPLALLEPAPSQKQMEEDILKATMDGPPDGEREC